MKRAMLSVLLLGIVLAISVVPADAVNSEGIYEAALVGIGPDGSAAAFDHRDIVIHDDSHPLDGEILFFAADAHGTTVGRGVIRKQR